MFNVMKAQMYQLLRNNGTYYTFLAGLGVSLFQCFVLADGSYSGQLEGSVWLFVIGSGMPVILPMLSLAFVAMICGGDMGDKTINYEMLTGTRRSHVFMGRAVVSLIMSAACAFVTLALPILVIWAVNGWGNFMTVSDVALRVGTVIFPVVRMTAFFIFAIFLFRSSVAAALFGYMTVMAELLMSALAEELLPDSALRSQLSVDLIEKVLIPNNIGIDYVDGKDVQVVKDLLEMSDVSTAAISGLAGTAVFLLIGYLVFRRQDMN